MNSRYKTNSYTPSPACAGESRGGGHLNIKEWAEEDRPREKLEAKGASALTEAELLAILIGSGNTEESAVDLMRRLLMDCGGSLNTLARMDIRELTNGRYKGLGKAKAITILAACELCKRRMKEDTLELPRLSSSADIYQAFRPYMMGLTQEECHIMLLNTRLEILGHEVVSRGGLTDAYLDLRMVLRHALLHSATAIALAHNHPSGSVRPSRFDDDLTHKLYEACRLLNIKLIDHVVIGDGNNNYYSYSDNGKL